MKRLLSRRFAALIAVAMSLGLVAACTPPGNLYPGPPQANFTYRTTQFGVINNQDGVYDPFFHNCIVPVDGCRDEVYNLNIGFRVRIGEAHSASTFVVRGDTFDDLGDGETHVAVGGQQAATTFNGVNMVDVADLAFGAHLEIAGVWTWAMEEDFAGVEGVAEAAAAALLTALQALETGTLPSDPNQIVPMLLSSVGFGGVLTVLGSIIWDVLLFQDDAVGSRINLGIGATGALGSIIDLAVASASIPAVPIPVVSIPPDIEGGRVFRLGALPAWTDTFDQPGDGRYQHSFSI